MVHRDSTGAVQRIEPGEINWMTAGRGVEHSERTPDELRGTLRRTMARPAVLGRAAGSARDRRTLFCAYPASAVAELILAVRRCAYWSAPGSARRRQVRTLSPTLLSSRSTPPWRRAALDSRCRRRAGPVRRRPVLRTGRRGRARTLAVLAPGATPVLNASAAARIVLVGGQTLGRRFMSWNFVSSRASASCSAGRSVGSASPPVPGENEFVPSPVALSRLARTGLCGRGALPYNPVHGSLRRLRARRRHRRTLPGAGAARQGCRWRWWPIPARAGRSGDVRAYALNEASVELLRRLKVWDALPPAR